MRRRSKRELKRDIEALAGGPAGDVPDLTVVEMFNHDWEVVDSDRHLWQAKKTGEIRHWDPSEVGWPWQPDGTPYAGADFDSIERTSSPSIGGGGASTTDDRCRDADVHTAAAATILRKPSGNWRSASAWSAMRIRMPRWTSPSSCGTTSSPATRTIRETRLYLNYLDYPTQADVAEKFNVSRQTIDNDLVKKTQF